VEQLNNCTTPSEEKNTDDLSFVKLHSTLCFLMTKFQSHQCPQLGQFIIRHISLMIEHPNVADIANCRTLYLQLLQQWQNITGSLLEQRKTVTTVKKIIH
jgi:hypothetical protein